MDRSLSSFPLTARHRRLVQVEGLYFAASHGFEIIGPDGSALNYTVAHELLPTIQEALNVLTPKLL